MTETGALLGLVAFAATVLWSVRWLGSAIRSSARL